MRRVTQKVTLHQAKERLINYSLHNGVGPHKAAWLAEVIWPGTHWIRPQGAGAAAVRVLKKLGCTWDAPSRHQWGWMLKF